MNPSRPILTALCFALFAAVFMSSNASATVRVWQALRFWLQ